MKLPRLIGRDNPAGHERRTWFSPGWKQDAVGGFCVAAGVVLGLSAQSHAAAALLLVAALFFGSFERRTSSISIWFAICVSSASVLGVTSVRTSGYLGGGADFTAMIVAIAATRFFLRKGFRMRAKADNLALALQEVQTLADSVPQVLWGTEADGKCNFLNARYTEIFGLPTDAAIRDQTWARPVHPDDRLKMYQIWRNAVDNGRSDFRAYGRYLMRDGSYRWMQSLGRSVRSPATGEIVQWFGGLVDVDAEVKAQHVIERLNVELQTMLDEHTQRLTDAEWRLRAFADDRNIGFVEQDFSEVKALLAQVREADAPTFEQYLATHPDFLKECIDRVRILRANDTLLAMLGYDSVEDFVRGQRMQKDSAQRAAVQVLAALYVGKATSVGSTKLARSDGKSVQVAYAINFRQDGSSYAAVLDISERVKAREAIHHARREITRANRVASAGALSISVIHDISQPITAMSIDLATAIRIATSKRVNVANLKKVLERLRWNTQRLTEITTGTRDRIRNSHRTVERFAVHTLVEEARSLLDLEVEQSLASIEIRAGEIPAYVCADKIELQQVIVNLLVNALDAVETSDQKQVEVNIALINEGSAAKITVADRGPGISEEDIGRIFEPFFTTKPNGLGFGLQICRTTVEALGGTIAAKRREGGGSVFEFTLPADQTGQCSHGNVN